LSKQHGTYLYKISEQQKTLVEQFTCVCRGNALFLMSGLLTNEKLKPRASEGQNFT